MKYLLALIGGSLLVCALGCGGEYYAFSEAKDTNTPEAWRTFLEKYPDGVYAVEGTLLYDATQWTYALETDTSTAYQEYLDYLPAGEHVDEARSAVATIAWREAEDVGDRAAVEDFLARHGDSSEASQARKWLALRDLIPQHVEIGETRFAETSANHWSVSVDVKNIGDKAVRKAKFRVAWLDAEGHMASSRRYALIDPDDARLDAPDELDVPLDPGKSRTFELDFSKAQAADSWVADADHMRVELVELEIAE